MAKVIYLGEVIAESESTEVVEGNHYFPRDAVKWDYLKDSDHTSNCSWKGTARYYDVTVNGKTVKAGAWYYPEPKDAAKQIKDFVAFWKGIDVLD